MKLKRFIIGITIGFCLFLTSCTHNTVEYSENRADSYQDELLYIFGADCCISEGQTMTAYYLDKDSGKPDESRPYTYTQWQVDYINGYGDKENFIFNNRSTGLVQDVKNFMTDLIQNYYSENFFIPYLENEVDSDSVMYCKFYRLFSDSERPETSIMLDQRLQYESKFLECARINELKYDTAFVEYPLMLDVYCNVHYNSDNEMERQEQEDNFKKQLYAMVDAMNEYSNSSLNAAFYIIMSDENGFSDDFSFTILQGEYYTGDNYEVELHENFYGALP